MEMNDIQNAYMGVSAVTKICLGEDVVWPVIDYSQIPLTFEIISGGTIVWERIGGSPDEARTIQYRKNDGEWTSITSDTGTSKPYVNVVPGDKVEFKGTNTTYCPYGNTYNTFVGSATFKAYGNILSLIYGDNYLNETELPSGNTMRVVHNFDSLFWKNSGITDASNIIMPQNTKNSCYYRMFQDCVNLEKAPNLPTSVLEPFSYKYMFSNCVKLTYVKCLANNIASTDCTANWLQGVAAAGTFVKAPGMTGWTTGYNGIPANWTVIDADI